jgi:HAE1 family hydrophobic/amphiphilic exporter-1
MRIWMDPDQLQARGLTPSDVISAIQQQSQEVTAGSIGMPPAPQGQNFQYTVNITGRFNNATDFEEIVVKVDNQTGGRITRVKDIGRVELGAQTYSQVFTLNGKPAAGIGIFQTLEANALDVANQVEGKMVQLAKSFPPGLTYSIPLRHDHVRARIWAIQAMNELFGPIIGITLVLMSVFLPAAFIPGLTGKMFAQFALVIAATALLSAVNAATLKPTQCALWLRPPVPPNERNLFFRAFNAVYDPFERLYARLVGGMVARSGLMCVIALIIIGVAGYGLTRVATGFLPIEDQGYVLVIVQLPDGASLTRTKRVLDQVSEIAGKNPAVENVIAISGVSVLDNSSTLANAGVAYVVLKDWSERGKGEDLRSLFEQFNRAFAVITEARIVVFPPPPIQGIGNAGGFAMQIELRDGSFDLAKLQTTTNTVVQDAQTQTGLQRVTTSFRSTVPQIKVEVDRAKAETLQVSVDEVFATLGAYLGSSYVDQFNKFGRVFQVYVQADSKFRLRPQDIEQLPVRNKQGAIIPIGTMLHITQTVGPSLLSLYNFYPSSTVMGLPATGFSSGQAMLLMEQIADKATPPGMGFEWTAMSYQEKLVGNQMYYIFALSMLLVYLVLAGPYESWFMPVSVLLAVPLSLVGPVAVLKGLSGSGLDNNLYTQIGLVLLIALSAKNAILIVEVARERRIFDGKPIVEAALEAARTRFRPILMTSFAFILGVLPLVFATGAGASSRKSIGIAVASGMLASTCLAVLFVPSFFVGVRRFEEWRAARKEPAEKPAAAESKATG